MQIISYSFTNNDKLPGNVIGFTNPPGAYFQAEVPCEQRSIGTFAATPRTRQGAHEKDKRPSQDRAPD